MANIRVELELADGTFTTRMVRATDSVARLRQELGQAVVGVRQADQSMGLLGTSVGRTVTTLVSVTAAFAGLKTMLYDVVGGIVKTNAEFERLTVMMRGMSTSSEPMKEAVENVKLLRDTAKQVPYSLDVIRDSFVKLKAGGIDPASGAFRALLEAGAASGATGEQIKRASIALQQMSGKGVVQMEELRQQLGEAIPRATELMARGMGVSYGELVQALSKGTVSAKEAIQALSNEMMRTFGGSAQAQMQTFSGQMELFKTRLADLALSAGGKDSGFFDNIKGQLASLNTFLGGEFASKLAVSFGQALNTGLNGLTSFFQKIVDLRYEIMEVGKAFLYAFAFQQGFAIIQGVMTNVISTIASMRLQLGALAAGWATAGTAAQRAGVLMGFAAAATGSLLSILPALALGVVAVASYFDLFGGKAKSAWQELEKFGAVSQKQINDAKPLLEQEQNKLARMEEAYKRHQETMKRTRSPLSPLLGDGSEPQDVVPAALLAKRKEVAEMEKVLANGQTQVTKIEAEAKARAVQEGLDKELTAIRTRYDESMKALDKELTDTQRKNAEAGRSNEKTTEEHRRRQGEARLRYYTEQVEAIDAVVEAQKRLAEDPNTDNAARAAAQVAYAAALKQQVEAMDARRAQEAQMPGIVTVEKGLDFDKLFKKGEAALEKLKGELVEVRAQLSGAGGEAEKLAFQLMNGKVGDLGVEKVRDLAQALIDAQREKEKLDELLDGKNKLDQEILRTELKLRQEIIDIQTKGGTEAEKLRAKIGAGMYAGYSIGANGQIVAELDKMNTSTGSFTEKLKAAGLEINKSVGEEGASKVNVFNTALQQTLALFQQIAGAAAGINLPNPAGAGPVPGQNSTTLGPKGDSTNFQVKPGVNMNVNDQLVDIIRQAAAAQSKYNVEIISGLRNANGPLGSRSRHVSGEAIDIQLVDRETGARPGNYQDGKGFREYELFAQLARQIQMEKYPLLADKFAWGGYFWNGGRGNYGNLDSMHFDIGGQMGAGSWANGLDARSRAQYPNAISQGMGAGTGGSATPYADAANAGVRKIETTQAERDAAQLSANIEERMEKMRKLGSEAEQAIEGIGKTQRKVAAEIANNEWGTDPEVHKRLLKEAEEADRRLEASAKRRAEMSKAQRAEEALKGKRSDVDIATDLSRKRVEDPFGAKFSDSYRAKEAELQRLLDAYAKVNDPEATRRFAAESAAILQAHRDNEIRAEQVKTDEKARILRQEGMTEAQIREDNYQQEQKRRAADLANFAGTEAEKARLAGSNGSYLAALRQKNMMSGPLGQQMKGFADVGENLQRAATGWIDSSINAFATFVTKGKVDFKALADSIIQDLIKIAAKMLIVRTLGSVMPGMGGAGGAAKGGASAAGASAKMFHTGGILGGVAPMSRKINLPKFHTGGILGMDEVPFIGKRKEGVFTPEQMAAMAPIDSLMQGAGPVTIQTPINVTVAGGAGGNERENNQVGENIAKAIETQMRSIVGDELRKSRRPGGIFDKGR